MHIRSRLFLWALITCTASRAAANAQSYSEAYFSTAFSSYYSGPDVVASFFPSNASQYQSGSGMYSNQGGYFAGSNYGYSYGLTSVEPNHGSLSFTYCGQGVSQEIGLTNYSQTQWEWAAVYYNDWVATYAQGDPSGFGVGLASTFLRDPNGYYFLRTIDFRAGHELFRARRRVTDLRIQRNDCR